MISVVKPDPELDTKPNRIEEEEGSSQAGAAAARVSDGEERDKARVRLSAAEEGEANPARVKDSLEEEEEEEVEEEEEEEEVEEEEEEEEDVGVFELKNVVFEDENDRIDPKEETFSDDSGGVAGGGGGGRGNAKGEAFSSLLSEFDDFVANEKNGAMAGTSRALSYGFEIGDMVWGKVKSHPWWPGHIFNEAFATSSVRRTRREGHVLVAFFGDSSYGWFDPAELIPFDPHFSEKSQQTTSRNFVRAVEEAVDEASRRRAVGMVCKCRNPYNFRPAKADGYFAVDVPDYEQGVYSVSQIKKARDEFLPGETLGFVKRLALGPAVFDSNTIDFIKNRATIFAFRKAVFEEFDETYAQAFGVQSAKQSHDQANASNQQVKQPTRAPLSGPLVIAETLGAEKGSKKAVKVKDQSKKHRYLLKRRDEPSDSKSLQLGQMQASSSAPAVYVEDSSAAAEGEYVLQKRTAERTGFISSRSSSEDASGKDQDQAPDRTAALATQDAVFDKKMSLDKEKAALQETQGKLEADVAKTLTCLGGSVSPAKEVLESASDSASASLRKESDTMTDLRYDESVTNEGSQQAELNFSSRLDGEGVSARNPSSHPSAINAKHPVASSAVGLLKKAKVAKRPLGDMSSEKAMTGEKKKKKKKELGSEMNPELQRKHFAIGKGGVMVKTTKKPKKPSLAPREDSSVIQQRIDVGADNASGNVELNVQQLLVDLQAIALNPFDGAESSPSVAMQFFLRFRSLVYQKSLSPSPPSEAEPVEVRAKRSTSTIGLSNNSAGDNARTMTPKPVKSLVRPEDPTRAGRKRLPSDRQEEIAAKRLKKLTQLKSLAAEKKAGLRTLESQQAEGKEPVAPVPTRPVRPDSVKRSEPPSRVVEPTMLVLKFPPGTSLPSVAELKARFARFGSIDQSAIRVFWKSSQCRVVFRRKLDAQAAYKYAVGNNSLFGNVNVRYFVREVGAANEASEFDKVRGDETSVEGARAKDSLVERPSQMFVHQPLSQSTVQPRSILKKPAADEAGQVSRGAPRVKFMLGGEETNREEQLMVGNRNNFNNNASFAEGGPPATSVAMDFSSMNFQKVVPPSPSPSILPVPPQFSKAPLNNSHHTEVPPPRNMQHFNAPSAAAPVTPSIDISQQMLSLLTRCNDVVTNVTGFLGYVPYHPL